MFDEFQTTASQSRPKIESLRCVRGHQDDELERQKMIACQQPGAQKPRAPTLLQQTRSA